MNFAIISEYNPFHNGHKYQIQKLKSDYDCENIIIIQSGNFVQRGDISILSKFTRAKMALLSGADIVLEIPNIFATSSAMYFSKGSISILDRLNIIDGLYFGSENASVKDLSKISDILINEPIEFKNILNNYLKEGFSYPKSRSLSLSSLGYDKLIDTPNNILGVEYIKSLKQLNSSIQPYTINRTNNFHEKEINNNITSATSIRENITNIDLISKTIPENVFSLLKNDLLKNKYDINNLSSILHYIFISKTKDELIQIVDMNEHLYNRFQTILKDTYLIENIVNKMCSRNYTKTRINRLIINIILANKKNDLEHFTNNGYPFVRVLGFKKEKQFLLKDIIKKSDIKVIMNLKNANKTLTIDEQNLLYEDINKTNIFLLSNSIKSNTINANDFENNIIIV